MFDEAIKKYDEYRQRCFNDTGGISDYDAEIIKKLGQLNWLIAKAKLLNDQVINSMGPDKGLDINALHELEIIAESFYHFVGRLVELFKHNNNFVNIPKSDAERIRHQLLQHPEKQKDKQKSLPMFTGGSTTEGPKIKGYVGPEDSLEDKGLFINASEFNDKLIIVFNNEAQKT